MTTETTKEIKKSTKIVWAAILILLVVGAFYGLKLYKVYFAPNITGKEQYLYIKTGATIDDLYKEIKSKDMLTDVGSFSRRQQKWIEQRLKPGRYKLAKGMNTPQLINLIKAGNQDPLN